MNSRITFGTLALVTVLALANCAQAVPLYSSPGVTLRDDAGGTVGFIFTPTSDLLVTHLGFFDDDNDGNAQTHAVGLWNTSSLTALATVTVQTGTTSPLTGQYRYEPITPITLTAGIQYILGARVENASGDSWYDHDGSVFTLGLPVSGIQPRYSLAGGLNRPGINPGGTNRMYPAPNLIATVPEPSCLGLMSVGLIGLMASRRRSRLRF